MYILYEVLPFWVIPEVSLNTLWWEETKSISAQMLACDLVGHQGDEYIPF